MATLVGKKLSEVYDQITLIDKTNYSLYTGDGVATNFSPRYLGPIANTLGTAIWANGPIPVHDDPNRTGSLAAGQGIAAYATNYPTISAFSSGTTLSSTPQARLVLGTLGAQTLKNSDPAAYGVMRNYAVLSKELGQGSDRVVLKVTDNVDGLNSVYLFEALTSIPSGNRYIKMTNTNTANGGVCIENDNNFYPTGPNGNMNLGVAAAKWKELYCVSGAINTSDARHKSAPKAIDDNVLDAWGDVQLIAFKWLEAIREKGDDARWHTGVIAQQVRDAFAARGLDGTHYGLLCYDQWDEVTEPVYESIRKVVQKTNDNGELVEEEIIEQRDTGEVKVIREAGDLWSIRADQCLFMEAAFQRRNYKRLMERVEALEAGALVAGT